MSANGATYIKNVVLPAVETLLPPTMAGQRSRAMLLAIGMQESRFEYRRQIGGPARGFWQFEQGGGIKGVATHPATAGHLRKMLLVMQYDEALDTSYAAIEHNDTLAAVYARLLLWTLPDSLPESTDPDGAWKQYVAAWRPGRPFRATWDSFYFQACAMVEARV